MIRYVPTSGSAAATRLTEALWQLSTPPDQQGKRKTKARFCSRSMTDGSIWLVVDTASRVRVHPAAQIGGIADVLQPWIDAGELPPDTLTQLSALIEANKGGTLNLWDAFPQLFKDQSKTTEELVALGLIKTSPT